MNGYSFLT